MQLANTQTSPVRQSKVCTSLRSAADAKFIGKAGNLYRIPLELIRFREDFNPRNYEDEANQERIASFEDSYRAGRYVPPPELEWEDGCAWPVEGHRRVLGARRAGLKDLLCLEWKGTAFERRGRLAKAAKDTTFKPLESARNIALMKAENPDRSNGDIAAEIAVSVQAVEQALVLDRAPDDLKAMVEAGEVEAQAAITLVRRHGEKAATVARQLYRRIKADIEARAAMDAKIAATFDADEPAANDAMTGKPVKEDVAAKSGTRKPSAKSASLPKPKAPKVTVRAMRELKAKDVDECGRLLDHEEERGSHAARRHGRPRSRKSQGVIFHTHQSPRKTNEHDRNLFPRGQQAAPVSAAPSGRGNVSARGGIHACGGRAICQHA